MSFTASLRIVAQTFYAPSQAFASAKSSTHGFWLPLLLLMVALICGQALFYHLAQPATLINFQLAEMTNLTTEQRLAMREHLFKFHKKRSAMLILVVPITVLFTQLLLAAYFSLIGRLDKRCNLDFGDWFKLTWWASTPVSLFHILMIPVLLMSEASKLTPHIFNIASLDHLLFGFEQNHPAKAVTESVHLFNLWSIVLFAVGLQQWGNIKTSTAWLLACLPFLLLWSAIWLFTG